MSEQTKRLLLELEDLVENECSNSKTQNGGLAGFRRLGTGPDPAVAGVGFFGRQLSDREIVNGRILGLLAWLLVLPWPASAGDRAPTIVAEVTHVLDGDTIEVGGLPIRLQGWQRPKARNGRHRSRRSEPVGARPGTPCELDRDRTRDRCAGIYHLGGKDISEVMVPPGLPRDCSRFSDGRHTDAEPQATANARHREDLSPAQLLSAALNCAMATGQPIARDAVIRQAAFARAGIAFGTPPEPLKHHRSSLDLTPAAPRAWALSYKRNASPRRGRDGRLGYSPSRVSLPPRTALPGSVFAW